ncbi:trypsin-like serine protease [Salinispora arenicola]|uniref:trypsin-like serine protease n=1 Tax=Salinispora arenicola TaxID=168697 RepID=UPI0027DE1790|nr:trypsin-like serine protease [Salinispora arenicola]
MGAEPALHAASFTVHDVDPSLIDIVGAAAGATICKGDAGGPAFRESDGSPQLVAINNTSWQKGCLAETAAQDGATGTRVDDLTDWIQQNTPSDCNSVGWAGTGNQQDHVVRLGDYSGDCTADVINRTPTALCGAGAAPVTCRRTTGCSSDRASPRAMAGPPQHSPASSPATCNGDGRTDIMNHNTDGKLRVFPSTGDLTADNKLFTTSYDVGSGWTTSAFPRLF